jgi:cytochrome c oxidase subunit II
VRPRILWLSAMILLVAAGSSVQRAGYSQPAPRSIEIHAKRFSFDPNEITLKKGEPVVLVLTAEDVTHGLQFQEFNLNLTAKTNQPAQVEFTPEMVGEFIGHCSTFCGKGHGDMVLKLDVVE